MSLTAPGSSSSCRRRVPRAHSYCPEMHNLCSSTPSLQFDVLPTEHGTSFPVIPSPPDSSSPSTPPPLTCKSSGSYMRGVFSYEEVISSTPKRARAVSVSSTAHSPTLLPIGKRPAAQSFENPRKAERAARLGVGLGFTVSVPSFNAETARTERARRRHAIHFHSHAQFSEALRVILDCHEGVVSHSDRRDGVSESNGADDERNYLWGTDSEADDARHYYPECANMAVSRQSSVSALTAAFPSPPLSPPDFPLSFSQAPNVDPDGPLPPAPTIPACRTEFGPINDDFGGYRMTVIDPVESMARLEISMTQLEAFNPFRSECDSWFTDEIHMGLCLSPEYNDAVSPIVQSTQGAVNNGTKDGKVDDEDSRGDPSDEGPLLSETPATIASTFAEYECASFISHSSIDSATNGPRKRQSIVSVGLLPSFDFEGTDLPTATIHNPPPRSSSLAGLRPPSLSILSSRSTPSLRLDVKISSSTTKTTPFLFRPVRQTCTPLSPSEPTPSLFPSVSASIQTIQSSTCLLRVVPETALVAPTTPPRDHAVETLRSFMHVTPEQQPSRMSKLWNRACSGMSAGLRKDKSAKWLRGSHIA
ncbi:hypothetical protein BKA93DRAFT_755465 [Sparassis latifolia]